MQRDKASAYKLILFTDTYISALAEPISMTKQYSGVDPFASETSYNHQDIVSSNFADVYSSSK